MSAKTDQLRRQRAEKLDGAKALADKAAEEGRDLTTEENTAIDEALAAADGLRQDIERMDKLEVAHSSLDQPQQPAPKADPAEGRTVKEPQRETPQVSQKRRNLRNFYNPGVRPYVTFNQAEEDSFASDQWFRAIWNRNEQAGQWCRDHGISTRVMGEGQPGQSAIVPDQLESVLIDLRESFGIARQVSNVVQMNSDKRVVSKRATSISTSYPDEGGTISASDTTYDPITVTAVKLAALTRVSTELIEDGSFSVMDDLAGDMAEKFAEAEDDAFINGDGTSTYGHITGCRGKFIGNEAFQGVHTAGTGLDTYAEITAADLEGVLAITPAYATGNARWIVSRSGFTLMMESLAHAAGGVTVSQTEDGMRLMYYGYPVTISQKMDTAVATDLSEDVMALFGDFRAGVTFGNRRGITMATSSDVYFASDEIGIRATERYGIAFHGHGDATNAGPVVALMGD